MLKGVSGAANVADDLIIFRNCVEEYDRRVYQAQTADRRLTVTSVSSAYPYACIRLSFFNIF